MEFTLGVQDVHVYTSTFVMLKLEFIVGRTIMYILW